MNPKKISTLGPRGTFSQEAVLKYDANAEIVFQRTIYNCFESVIDGEVDLSIVPFENSVAGGLGETYDCLLRFRSFIVDEILVSISHHLVGNREMNLKDIRKIYTHPQSYAQCENYIRLNLEGPEIINTSSNAASAQQVKTDNSQAAAIVPGIAIPLYELTTLDTEIHDNKHNTTRFIVLADDYAGYELPFDKHERYRTSIIARPADDKPGILHSLTVSLAAWDVNMSKIVSRPAKGKLGDYVFYIDFHGHRKHAKVKKALADIKQHFGLKVLGSYLRLY